MSRGKILVVDDDRNLLELLGMVLRASEYEVTTAKDGEASLEAVKNTVFDMAVLDLKLPHTDGITLMRDIHQINPGMPVIILTAHSSVTSAVDAIRMGAFNYLEKPFDPDALVIQIERALENRKLHSEIKRLEGVLEE
ncbi:MAG: sigma-54-dependent Fis family transcriptional regulator, partial [Deltaproteobacteria bacterium]|nr:sigma-54-dependent Fis family transcriptional regulator [Deltaproteobacteria bacterium]